MFKINANYILKTFVSCWGAMFSALAILDIFWNITDVLNDTWKKIWLILVITLSAFIVALLRMLLKGKVIIPCGNNEIRLCYGDFFKIKAPIKAFAVNRCFDMEVSDKLIAQSSVHGKWILRQQKKNGISDIKESIERQLNERDFESLDESEKPLGNTKRYPVGTVVTVKDEDTQYYLLGLTTFNHNLNAKCTLEEYLSGFCRLLEYYNAKGQADDLCICLMGAGNLSRMHLDGRLVLELMISLLKANCNLLIGNVTIVINKKDRGKISILNLL